MVYHFNVSLDTKYKIIHVYLIKIDVQIILTVQFYAKVHKLSTEFVKLVTCLMVVKDVKRLKSDITVYNVK